MTNRNRPAVDVHNRRVPTHVLVDGTGLRGKGLVRLDQIQIANLPARLVQRLAAGKIGPTPMIDGSRPAVA